MEYSLTNPQNSIWLTEKFYPNTSINNISGYTYISEVVDFKALTQAVNEVIKTNDAMRIKIKEENNKCVQYITEYIPFDVETINLSSENDIEKKSLELAKIPFKIEENILFKFTFFKLPNQYGGFFLSAHHIIGDSWSLGLVVKQVMLNYSNIKNNTYSTREHPSYISYINDEKKYLESSKFLKDKEYWNDIFKTVPEIATIPSLKKSTNISSAGNRANFTFDISLVKKINEFCKANNISLYNFFMSVYSLYLGRVSNLDDFVIGTPILNRTNFEQKNTVGMFISTTPLRVNLNHELTFVDFINDVSAKTISLFRHQRYPYQYILEDIRKRDSSIPNLYNVVLSYQITKTFDEESGVNYSAHWLTNGCCADDLQIHLLDLNNEGNLHVAYDYKTDKYTEQDIADLHARILTIVDQVMSNNDIILKNIEIVTPEEKHKILYDFNNTKVDYPKDKTIVDLFEEQVNKTPDNIAVVFENQKLTYRELNEKANQLARYLITKNIQSNDIIVLLFNRSLEIIISMLAVLKSGAAYLPLDPEYPEERLNFIFNDCKPKLILSDNKSNNVKFNNTTFYKSTDVYFNKFDTANLNTIIKPYDMSYLIYTSGSTGKPKGVILNHMALSNLANYCNKKIAYLRKNDQPITMVSITTISFDIFIFESLIPLQRGLTIVVANTSQQLLPNELNKLIKTHNITAIQSTPSRIQIFLNNLDIITNLKNIKYFTLAGEPLPLDLSQKLHALSNATIYNGYGPSETTVFATLTDVTAKKNQMTIGRPIYNNNIYILDKNKRLCPIGVSGEIYISGDNVGLGYFNNQVLTSASFIKDPFFSNNKMYKSGDLGYYLTNGEIVCQGRLDNQIKIHGLRIELEEIESIIKNDKNILDCIVTKYVSGINTEHLCVYYIKNTSSFDINALKVKLFNKLPNYMVPEYFVEMSAFPHTPNGKIDKKRLPLPSTQKSTLYMPPRNNIDKSIIDILKKILEIHSDISINESFYSLGGDSLTAITFSTYVFKKFGVSISTKDILDNPVIMNLSDYISTFNLSNQISSNTINRAKKMDYYPISSAQRRIYYAAKLDDKSVLYNISGGVIINKELNIKKLESCFKKLITRHESLRTHFDIINNDIVQVIDDNIDFNLSLEISSLDDLNKIYHDFVRPFDLSIAPLFRTKVVKLNNNKMLILLDMHHIISDGTSLNILLQELCDLYNNNKLSEKNLDYKDFTLWEKSQFETDSFKKSREFWVNQFKDEIPLLNMPTDYPRPSVQSFEGSNYHTKLSKETFDKINKVAQELNITPYMLMLSCYYILLSKYTSQSDIVIGSPIIGRELPELSNIIGMFVNTLSLRTTVDSSLSFDSFSQIVKTTCLDCFKNQSYPFDILVKDLNIQRDPSRNPLFDTMFSFQSEGYPRINFDSASVEYFIPDNNISKFDISLDITPVDNELSIRLEYCTKLFDEEFIKRFSLHYINILNTILNNKRIKISDIDILSEIEKKQILYDFNNTSVDYPKNKTVVNLFEEQVKKTPNNIAVIFENQKLTYHELNEKSNQLAKFLVAKSVKHGDIICLLLDKSLEAIVSMIAILKCGAIFLPIDVAYPKERINYIITNSKSKNLLTTQDFVNKANYSINTYCIDLNNSSIYSGANENLNTFNSNSNDIAYIMYTSGSTGNPKGVMVTHKNIVRLVKNNKFINFDKDEHILQTGSIVFDACTFEIWGSLLNGFELHIITKFHLLDPIYLKNYIDTNKITSLFITTQLFNQLGDADPLIFMNMKNLLTGGESVSVGHMNTINQNNPNLNIIHCYGPTENTTFSTCYNVPKHKFKNTVPIGSPISNSTCYVVFPSGHLCPIGVPGELWVGGDGVSNGYLNNKELTKEKFINNPFGKGKIYKTGDLVKWLPDGNIEFIGRIDNQVKVRGFRIELNEIDSKILSYPNIKYSTTITQEVNNSKVICSYFVSNETIDINDLKMYLQNSLPYFMIPSYIMQLDHFELNINGKIDKKYLPSDFRKVKRTRKIEIPKTNTEIKIFNIFKKVLNIDDISISDDLFKDLQGDSLTAMKIQIEALSNNINLDYADIFKYSTIKTLSAHINNEKNNKRLLVNNFYDYSKYDSILCKNTLSEPLEISETSVGNILLTGFTGFLGAHILDSFLKKESGIIYCLIREKNQMTPIERLYNVLHFYFGKKYDKYVGNRIKLIDGDLTLENFGLKESTYSSLGKNISTVIHSAALVKHYGMYEDFEKANVLGTQNIVNFCIKFNLKLLHISTLSVSGNNFADGSNVENNFETDVNFSEKDLYIGQNLEGLYAKSKFEAECVVLDAILNSKLQASILRMGNLTSRFSEGKFQQNHFENAFVNRFKSFLQIGQVPDYMLNLYAEFTPIDCCGDAIIKIAKHFNKKYTVFHLMNEKRVYLDRLFKMMNSIGIKINIVSEENFIKTINKLLLNDDTKVYIQGIINDFNKNTKHLEYESKVKVQCDFSKTYLEKLGFSWPYIDVNYIKNYFKYLEDIGYLNTK